MLIDKALNLGLRPVAASRHLTTAGRGWSFVGPPTRDKQYAGPLPAAVEATPGPMRSLTAAGPAPSIRPRAGLRKVFGQLFAERWALRRLSNAVSAHCGFLRRFFDEACALLKAGLSASLGVRDLFEPLARMSVDHSGPVRDDDELHSVARPEFHQDSGDVSLGGEWAEVKLLRDFGVG